MCTEKIIKAESLMEMIDEINEFCRQSYLREDDTECFELKTKMENREDSDMHRILSSYLSVCETGDEIIESLYEFMNNCRGFAETEGNDTKQVTKEEFEEILDECEEKCGLKSCIENDYEMVIAETELKNSLREFSMRIKGKYICDFLPRIDINIDTKKFIAEEIGSILYDVLRKKIGEDYIRKEMNRYIPQTRTDEADTRILFQKNFYDVVLYREEKPRIYTDFDDNFKRIFAVEYFKRIILIYLKVQI